jgi:multiple sugar transport system permease protein
MAGTGLAGGSRSRSGGGPNAQAGRAGIGMISPFALLFAVFFVLPFGYALYVSFTRQGTGAYVGAQNYRFVLTSPAFWSSLGRVAYFGVIAVTLMVVLSLFLALLLDSPYCVGKKVFRLLFFIPYAVPGVIASIMWAFLYSPQIDNLLRFPIWLGFGHSPFDPLSAPAVLYAIVVILIWETAGYNMTLYLTGLASIPQEILEAATVDGCSELRLAWRIKIPMIRKMLMFTSVLSIITTLQLFNEPQILGAVASLPSGYTPNIMVYDEAFQLGNLPMSAAMSLVLGVITVAATALFYYGWRLNSRRSANISRPRSGKAGKGETGANVTRSGRRVPASAGEKAPT